MSEHTYKLVELVGSSTTGIEDAIQSAISRACSTLEKVRWFEVTEPSGALPTAPRTAGTL